MPTSRRHYTVTYLRACTHLVQHGAWDGDRLAARRMIARALRELRNGWGRDRARRERYHMRQIAGMFPAKNNHPHFI